MYRPALMIGVGGTGILTLRHLKALLMASEEHRLPPQVRLVALDTVKDEKQSVQTSKDVKIAALQTELEPGEYYWIGGDVHDFVRQIDNNEQPQIGSWFQARPYLEALPRSAFALERGAGQLRQFGRLAIFHDVSAPNRSSIYNLINRAINQIRQTGFYQTIDVFLVASVAGGTGAGMFVDAAYLVRQIAKEDHQLTIRLRGFLVLPEAFSAIPGGVRSDMRARAYACMRENKRFMVDFQYDHGYPMSYHPSGKGGVWRGTIKTKLFDFIYHIDGQSKRNSLTNVKPEFGVTAAIADTIAAMLDKSADGQEDVYDRHTTNVVAQAAQQGISVGSAEATSFDSAVGSFSLVLPMHHITQGLAYRLALEALGKLVTPIKKDEDGYPTELATDANAEMPNVQGREMAVEFLKMAEVPSWRTDQRVANPRIYQEMVRVALSYRPNDASTVQEVSSREARDWEQHLDPSGTTAEIKAVRQRVQQALTSRLVEEVPPNQRGENAGSALERIQQGVERYKAHHLGREDPRTGQRVGGHYRTALSEYARLHLERYRLMLEVESENILNGGQNPDNPLSVQRAGKLGYMLDWLGGLEEIIGRFIQAINNARVQRENRGEKQSFLRGVSDAQRQLEKNPGGFFAGRRRNGYLDAEQELINLEKALIIEDVVYQLANQILQHTRELHESALSWARTLALGYDSLYGHLVRGERRIQDAIKAEQQVPVREYVWDQVYLDQLYNKYTQELKAGLDEYLDKIFWRHERQRSGSKEQFSFRLSVRVSEDDSKNRLGMENQERSLNLLLSPAREVFTAVWQQESILKYLMSHAPYTSPTSLADHLAAKTDVLLSAGGSSVVPANYLHVAHGTDPSERDYLTHVRQRLESKTGAKGQLSDVVNSADRFALRLVYTLDLIPLHEVSSYRNAEKDYWGHVGEVQDGQGMQRTLSRETLHLFPAEVNAARLESRIPTRLHMTPRALHNDIVLQLEDMDRFRLFVRCWAFNLIRRKRRAGQSSGYENYWALDLPAKRAKESSVRASQQRLSIYLTRPIPGAPSVVEAMKVWNYQQRDVRPDRRVPIPYDRVREAIQESRDKEIEKRQKRGQEIDNPAISQRVNKLPDDQSTRFKRLWLERNHLKQKQETLQKVIADSQINRLESDAALAWFMVLDEDIDSLEQGMDDLLQSNRW